jgi:uncharacterized membrane protein (DUF485 family)
MTTEAHHADQHPAGPRTLRAPAQPVDPSPLSHRGVASGLAELEHNQRRLAGPFTVVFLAYYSLFLLLTALAPELLRVQLFWHLSLGYLLAWSVLVVSVAASVLYLRLASARIDPLVERIRRRISQSEHDAAAGADGEATLR